MLPTPDSTQDQAKSSATPGRKPTTSLDEQTLRTFGLLRDIRVRCQDTQRSFAEIKTAYTNRAAEAGSAQLKDALETNDVAFKRQNDSVERLSGEVKLLFDSCSSLHNDFGDDVSFVVMSWDRVVQYWPKPAATNDELGRVLPKIEGDLRQIVWHCGFVTIPPRVDEHLGNMRVGQALDFSREFSDELPEASDRTEMLKFLSDHQLLIGGIVDAEEGIIYRTARSAKERNRSFMHIALLLVIGLLFACVFCYLGFWLNLATWPMQPSQLRPLLIGYLFVLLGGLAHVGIAAYKQTRSTKKQPFAALDDVLLWIHVKEWPIFSGILLLWCGLFGMAFLGKLPDWQAAFFVGYSIDSIADVVLQRFEAAVPKPSTMV